EKGSASPRAMGRLSQTSVSPCRIEVRSRIEKRRCSSPRILTQSPLNTLQFSGADQGLPPALRDRLELPRNRIDVSTIADSLRFQHDQVFRENDTMYLAVMRLLAVTLLGTCQFSGPMLFAEAP